MNKDLDLSTKQWSNVTTAKQKLWVSHADPTAFSICAWNPQQMQEAVINLPRWKTLVFHVFDQAFYVNK